MPHEKYLKGFPSRAGGSNVFFLFHHAGGNPSERGKGVGAIDFPYDRSPSKLWLLVILDITSSGDGEGKFGTANGMEYFVTSNI